MIRARVKASSRLRLWALIAFGVQLQKWAAKRLAATPSMGIRSPKLSMTSARRASANLILVMISPSVP